MNNDPELRALRNQIDDINQRLVQVLHERASIVRRIGVHKLATGMAIVDSAREQTMLRELMSEIPANGYSATALQSILRAVFEASRELVAAP
jgi:chorismate mutase